MKDFSVRNFHTYSGPNYYLDRPAMIFSLFLTVKDYHLDTFVKVVSKVFPEVKTQNHNNLVDLFTYTVTKVISLDKQLTIPQHNIVYLDEEWVIAIENFLDKLSKQAVFLVSDWFKSIANSEDVINLREAFRNIKKLFAEGVDELPMPFELIKETLKAELHYHYLKDEDCILWGYGKNQIRSRKLEFNSNSAIDTGFINNPFAFLNFLDKRTIPVPQTLHCQYENDLSKVSKKIGFPLVMKSLNDLFEEGYIGEIKNIKILRKEFNKIQKKYIEKGLSFDGILVQQQLNGDHFRILLSDSKLLACRKISPASVTGNGTDSIENLIDHINKHQRSDDQQIMIDEDLKEHLADNGISLDSIPGKDEKIRLRKTANLAKGGVSEIIKDTIHPDNQTLFENITSLFNISIAELEVISSDLTSSWTQGNLWITGMSINPPLTSYNPFQGSGTSKLLKTILEQLKLDNKFRRIPIITGNHLSDDLIGKITSFFNTEFPDLNIGSIKKNGIYINNAFFTNCRNHSDNCSLLLRNPKLDLAIINHNRESILEFGTWHYGNDLCILEKASHHEYIMMRDLLMDGILVEIKEKEKSAQDELVVSKNIIELYKVDLQEEDNLEIILLEVIKPYLVELPGRYSL